MSRDPHRTLTWLLRHGANEARVAMDAAGWCAIADVLEYLHISRAQLDGFVAADTKSRLEIREARRGPPDEGWSPLIGDQIRVAQGHSLAGVPVTLEALEASWTVHDDLAPVWHGTNRQAVPSIGQGGLLPGERTHVHLASELHSKVGKRAQVDVMIEITPARLADHGLVLYRSANGVLLARRVPPSCFTGMVAISRAARASELELRRALGLLAG